MKNRLKDLLTELKDKKKKKLCFCFQSFFMVGVTGFEHATSSSRTKRSTKLSHTPIPPYNTITIFLFVHIKIKKDRGAGLQQYPGGETCMFCGQSKL